ncbi:FecR family protein [Chitinophaga pendula]|uniref:FecR family protein n=1 Tax=Chitinophaga TaxID=79328 RepID=UPI000BAFEE59|nr:MULTISPECIES: FecR family protein [Chitinophaga]ASZ14723.1 hypothetical protein CK934_29140 [Chitinophaga sp. MD30]UCJ07619.1 FecR family protein [Chitinophaga pendula]
MIAHYKKSIEKVWKETLTATEKLDFLDQLLRDEAAWKNALRQEFDQDVDTGKTYLSADQSTALLQRLYERMQVNDIHTPQPANKKVFFLSRHVKWWGAAAAAAVAGILFLLYAQPPASKTRVPSIAQVKIDTPAAKQIQRYTNNQATRQTITLEDSSIVILAKGSAITYYKGFPNNKREIRLSGQAWFQVAANSDKPFTVYTANIATTALGTRFMVNTKKEQQVLVQLFEGKVVVRSATQQWTMKNIYLQPGEECRIDPLHKEYQVRPFTKQSNITNLTNTGATLADNNGNLQFTQTPLPKVLTQLGQRYQVHFRYETAAINKEQVTGSFPASDSLETTLSILRTLNKLSFNKNGDTITVSKQ